jgi:hypothetical protein
VQKIAQVVQKFRRMSITREVAGRSVMPCVLARRDARAAMCVDADVLLAGMQPCREVAS